MLIQMIIVSALATAFGIGLNNYRQRLRCRRSGEAPDRGTSPPIRSGPPSSAGWFRRTNWKTEALLLNLRIASDALVTALAVEENLGAQVYASDGKDQSLFEQWTASRRADEQAHEAYNLAVQEYREFVQSLAPPLRAQAAERGYSAMAVAGA